MNKKLIISIKKRNRVHDFKIEIGLTTQKINSEIEKGFIIPKDVISMQGFLSFLDL